jgi:hypothetical protein
MIIKNHASNHYWKNLDPYAKHMALMYHYRLRTEPATEIKYYLEAQRYFELKIKTHLLPDYIFKTNPEILRKDAYEAIGRKYQSR